MANTKSLFHFDNNYTDATGNLSMTVNGTASFSSGKIGSHCVSFGWGTSYISSQNSAIFNIGTGDYTLDGWASCGYSPNGEWIEIFSIGSMLESSDCLAGCMMRDTYLYVRHTDRWINTNFNLKTQIDSKWAHIAAVRTNGQVVWYVNGVSIYTLTDTYSYTVNQPLRVGRRFAGGVDELRFSTISRWQSDFTPLLYAYDNPAIHGYINDSAKIYVIKESTNTIETTYINTPGNYIIVVDDLSARALIAETTEGQIVGYGQVMPVSGTID